MSVKWIYGRPCSGKSHILKELDCLKFDSHDLRQRSNNWDLSAANREANIRNLAAMAAAIHEQGHDVAVAAITPKRAQRVMIRSMIPDVEFNLADFDSERIELRQTKRFGRDFKDDGFEDGI